MVKKIIAVASSFLMLLCIVPFAAFADVLDTCPKCGERTYVQETGLTVDACGIGVTYNTKHCTSCRYSYYEWSLFGRTGYKEFESGTGDNLVADFISEWIWANFGKNANFKKYETGGGSAGTGGVGRRPSGYVDDKGTPSFNVDGNLIFYVPITGWSVDSSSKSCGIADTYNHSSFNDGQHVTGVFPLRSGYKGKEYFKAVAYFTAPVSGKYYLYNGDVVGLIKSPDFASYKAVVSWNSSSYVRLSQGDKRAAYCSSGFLDRKSSNSTYEAIGYGFHMMVVPNEVTVNKQTNITINNNTWNGNIYQDNSTNLTYIYPQYTTINENNETVTNISNNPIIYNNETKQYYTYDTVTNNYYYITYEAPTPSPSPDPDPTPTPEPGGDTGDTSGIMKILQEIKAVLVSGFAGITEKLQNIGVGGSTPETAKPGSSSGNKGQSWWEKLLGKIGDAIMDGLLGAISAVLKLIFKLFTTILGWIIWLVSQVLTLFPFLPPGLGALLIGGVVVCFIIGLIKFIRG